MFEAETQPFAFCEAHCIVQIQGFYVFSRLIYHTINLILSVENVISVGKMNC